MDPLQPLTSRKAGQRCGALARFALLQPHLEHGITLRALAAQHGLADRTLQA